jgi:23S rRNA (adenine2503-C2)-methyltransferase
MTTLRFEVGMSHRGAEGHQTVAGLDRALPAMVVEGSRTQPVSVKRPILATTTAEFRRWFIEQGHPAYRAGQVLDWMIRRRATSFEAMTNLPGALRQQLGATWTIFTTAIAHQDVAEDGTTKLVLACADGRRIECVLMAEGSRRTVCVSTQVGCGIGCIFCASGLKGVERNLNTGEILEQVFHLRNLLPAEETVTHVVVMGMGESLANLDALVPALDRLCSAQEGLGISQRRVTISTVGLPEKIMKLAALDRQYHLAVSLHAPTEALRNTLVPINERTGLSAVMAAADAYFEQTGRQVTYEYVMLNSINDRDTDARALAHLLGNRRAHVNLIPYNPVAGLPFERPDAVSVTVRKTKGRAIDAACGQLRRRLDEMPGPVFAGGDGSSSDTIVGL